MKCSCQSDTKFDQSDYKLKVVVKLGDQYLSREVRFFSAYHSRSKLQEGMRNDQQSHYSLEEEYNLRGRTQGLCGTELTTNARPQLKTSVEKLAMEVVKLFAQVSHQVDNDLFVEVKKLIQIWKLQPRFLRKACVVPSVYNKLLRDKFTRRSI